LVPLFVDMFSDKFT